MTLIVKCKCRSCSLHFEAFSWQKEWVPSFCPECGSRGPFLVWVDHTDKEIFQLVPGRTTMLVGT